MNIARLVRLQGSPYSLGIVHKSAKKENGYLLFVRINSSGTNLSGDDLVYSVYNHLSRSQESS